MPANVKLMLWVQCADGAALPESANSVIERACDRADRTLREVIPDALNVSIDNVSEMQISNDAPLQSHCIMVAVRVQRDAQSLDERIALCQQVQNTVLGELQPTCSLMHMELNAEFEPYGSSRERLG